MRLKIMKDYKILNKRAFVNLVAIKDQLEIWKIFAFIAIVALVLQNVNADLNRIAIYSINVIIVGDVYIVWEDITLLTL